MSKRYIKENNCDLIALTRNGAVIGYTIYDQEVDKWKARGKEYDWFPVDC